MDKVIELASVMLLAALVIFRVGRILTQEEGPFGVFEALRIKTGIYSRVTWIQRGLMCVLCLTFWPCLVFGFWLAWREGQAWPMGLVYGLATSGLIVLFSKGD